MKPQNNNTYTDLITNTMYRVPKNQEKQLRVYQNRYVIAIMLAIFMTSFNVQEGLALIIAGGFAVMSELMYRFKFLKSLPRVPLHAIKQKDLSTRNLMMNTVLYGVLGGLLIYVGLNPNQQDTPQWVLVVVGGGALVVALIYGIKVIQTSKEPY